MQQSPRPCPRTLQCLGWWSTHYKFKQDPEDQPLPGAYRVSIIREIPWGAGSRGAMRRRGWSSGSWESPGRLAMAVSSVAVPQCPSSLFNFSTFLCLHLKLGTLWALNEASMPRMGIRKCWLRVQEQVRKAVAWKTDFAENWNWMKQCEKAKCPGETWSVLYFWVAFTFFCSKPLFKH